METVPSTAVWELQSQTLGSGGLGNLTLEWKGLEDISDAQNCCTRRLSRYSTQLLVSLGGLILKCEFA